MPANRSRLRVTRRNTSSSSSRATTHRKGRGRRSSGRQSKGWFRRFVGRHRGAVAVTLVVSVVAVILLLRFGGAVGGKEFVPRQYELEGALWMGELRHDKPHGPGVMQLDDGTVLAGTWHNGVRVGVGRESDVKGRTTYITESGDELRLSRLKGATEGDRLGIDLSHHQRIYWGAMMIALNADGTLSDHSQSDHWVPVDFVIAKASEGKNVKDDLFHYHAQMADLLCIPLGAYHVLNPKRNAQEQVDNFLKQIEEVRLSFPPVLDIEGSTRQISEEKFTKVYEPVCVEWLKEVERRTGVRPMIYCCRDFYEHYGSSSQLASYRFWIASYGGNVSWPQGCRLRQISETGRLSGWDCPVDIDLLKKQ